MALLGAFLTAGLGVLLLPLFGLGLIFIIGSPIMFIILLIFLKEGKCPYCNEKIYSYFPTSKRGHSMKCRTCKRRILIKDNEALKMPE